MSRTIRLGISTCPNDTFAFHGLMGKCVDWRGLDFDVELCDVQALNQRLGQGDFDVAKASFHAALGLTRSTIVLRSGSALGFGVGPLLLSTHPDKTPDDSFDRPPVVLCPGADTTATLLYRLFFSAPAELRQVVFSEIMPLLVQAKADFGVCIHEGRFTWRQSGLFLAEDLGKRWEQSTGTPLPLGGILARRELGLETIRRVQSVVYDSIQFGLQHREKTLPTMRQFAQEFSDDILMAHVDLYVNQHTVDLGSVGTTALHQLFERAVAANVVERCTQMIEVLDQ